MNLIASILFAVVVAGYGLYILITPYEKFKAKAPKAPAEKNLKVLGIILILLGIISLVPSFL